MTIVKLIRALTLVSILEFIVIVMLCGIVISHVRTIRIYEEALRFYAEPMMWEDQGHITVFGREMVSPALVDAGEQARVVLGTGETG